MSDSVIVLRTSAYCTHCRKTQLMLRDRPNHVLHFVLTLATVGFWVVPWYLISIGKAGDKFRCKTCGTEDEQSNLTTKQKAIICFAFLAIAPAGSWLLQLLASSPN